ncbi:MAG TPA: tetratricopeptide repeat protein [Candidatus Sulfotelmatobacter sp.]|nr:tetratricopeptide repeat protein [Candidatus Sulfotelmatobacter sp.]
MKIRACGVFCLLCAVAAAQVDPNETLRQLRLRVQFNNGICDPDTRVALMGHKGQVAEATPNEQCVVEFVSVPSGNYEVVVSGRNFSQVDAGSIDASRGAGEFDIKVNRDAYADATRNGQGASVSVADLALPPKARKELAKASQLMQKQDFADALDRLNKIVAQYPSYATAYNNLAVIYARQGDLAKERDALEHAIAADDHFAPPYVNLARLDINTKNFGGAEEALNKAASLAPADAMTLVLLGYAQFMNHHLDDAIATAKKAHTLQGGHAFTHQVAARAYEQKQDAANAIAQLQLFLEEEPTGPRAEIAHNELAAIQSSQRAAAAGTSQ